jgi:hypothetical protein
MLATRVRQKEGTFYFVSYKVRDLLAKAEFISRYYFEGETLAADTPAADDLMKQKKLLDHWASLGTEAFTTTTQVWAGEAAQKFRAEGFDERFPAKGRVERVRRIHLELTRTRGLAAPEPEEADQA